MVPGPVWPVDAAVSFFVRSGSAFFPRFAIARSSSLAVLIALALAVVRALKGPTVFDRVLAGHAVGTLAILLLAVVGF